MQAFPRVSLQKRFFGRKRAAFLASFLVNPLLASSESLRSETSSLRLSENSSIYTRNSTASAGGDPPTVSTLTSRFLFDKQGWVRPVDRRGRFEYGVGKREGRLLDLILTLSAGSTRT
jgi:hypothetical protein